MKGPAHKTLILTVCIIVGIMSVAGCEEEVKPAETNEEPKLSRFIAIENRELKKQIEELKKTHAGEIKQQKELLAKCEREKKDLEEVSSKGIESYMSDLMGPLTEENTKLKEENKALKAEIEKLKSETP